MLQHIPEEQHEPANGRITFKRRSYGLQIILWTIWTLTVVTTGFVSWHADIVAQRPVNLLGLVIHCAVVGVIGLIVLTVVEMRFEPWRFLE
jgi:ABC-type xylose transport system permease subunit